ncbi:PDR/VanB family oxidoreductase [Paraburkholderia sp. J41]|uniref:PDR/VanB family oxidoreductase n=1 Tax=Paraburkholderia sp. J41 TaxID=2805433 RepID=UPI002AC3271D|nr:PDR/VanB family oxidoreductase [Paraburkholderia sp. J41]
MSMLAAVASVTPDPAWLDVRVRSVQQEARNVRLIELQALAGELPAFEPGAHIAVDCGEGRIRHYSLCGPLDDRAVYRLGVKLEADGRGGSQWLWNHANTGAALRVSAPRNNFPLVCGKPHYLFLSGGIGVTPVIAMLDRLRDLGVRARHVHMCRTWDDLAFNQYFEENRIVHDVHVHVDASEHGFYDLHAELASAAPDTEVYCCGPAPMMEAVYAFAQTSGRASRFHFEFFAPPAASASAAQPGGCEFVVVQNSTGREIPVREDQTMLSALREAGVSVQSECEYGVCGWCATRVLAGEPHHLDSYLTDAERTAKNIVLPCVSRCSGGKLVLDL